MKYQVVKFQYNNFQLSTAEVIHWPNWFERLFRKQAKLVQYTGFVDYWVRTDTKQEAPYALRAALLTEWHNHDLAYFQQEVVPKFRAIAKIIINAFKTL